MPSRSLKPRTSLFLFVATLQLPHGAVADVVVGETTVTYGTVVSATAGQVNVRIGCSGEGTTPIRWDEIRSIVFDSECREHEVNPPSAGLLPCTQARIAAFRIYPGGGQPVLYAGGIQLQGDLARIALLSDEGTLTGPRQSLSSLARLRVCPTELTEAPPPAAFCFEPVQRAVNWSLDPAMPNTVFTRGFAVYLETRPAGARAPQLDIRGALGTALTVWISGLLKYKEKLGPTVGAFLQSTVSRSTSFTLLTPPQVIQVKCRENASMIVRVSAARGGDFAAADSGYLAKAQIEGRTVLLNAADHRFTYALNRRVNQGEYDLIWVMSHELGHSFGLPDEYLGADVPSIMNPDTRPPEITERDAVSLARSLEKSVKGTTPGYFNATRCGGLRIGRIASRRTPKAKGK